MNPSLTEPGVLSPATRPASPKFTYASGERPLPGYTVKRGVGWGGFGEVYYATTDAGKECALKLIRRNLDIELRGVTQCLNLKHPNLIALFDIRQDEREDTWVIMEFVSGESLEDMISRHPSGMPLADAMHWFDGLTAGVAYLHDHGIVHRDLKPGNIFSDEGIVKVGDYGLSKFISCSRRSGQTESVGTVHYMAPEIANGRYGKEIDIYALGVILYEILTGHVPFDGESVGEVLMKHLTGEPNLDRVGEPFRSLIARALAKNPEKRIRSVGEMRQMLAGTLPQERSPQHAFSSLPPSERPSQTAALSETVYPQPAARIETPVKAQIVAEDPNPFREPIARAVYEGLRRLKLNWDRVQLPQAAKVVALIVGAVAVLSTSFVWIWAVLFLTPMYAVYWVVRAMLIPPEPLPAPPARPIPVRETPAEPLWVVPPVPVARPIAARPVVASSADAASAASGAEERNLTRRERLHRRRRRNRLPSEPKAFRDRATEATGAMLLAALLALAFSVVANLIVGRQQPEVRAFTWIAVVTALGAWAVIVPAKIWEGRRGDPVARRSVMLVLGMLVGLVAFALSSGFALSMPYGMQDVLPEPTAYGLGPLNDRLYGVDGSPGVWAHSAYFAFLLLVPTWWWQADGSRRRRVSFWTVAMMAGWAYVLSIFWTFPQPWGMIVAAGISLVTQLATPVDERVPAETAKEAAV